jgi:hypothetical protein
LDILVHNLRQRYATILSTVISEKDAGIARRETRTDNRGMAQNEWQRILSVAESCRRLQVQVRNYFSLKIEHNVIGKSVIIVDAEDRSLRRLAHLRPPAMRVTEPGGHPGR